jgi:hypothetical protein
MPANQPKFTSVPAIAGWWAKIAVRSPERDPGAAEFVYAPVALWLVYYDEVLGVSVDAPQAVGGGGEPGGHGRLSQLGGFAGFVYEPDRTEAACPRSSKAGKSS